MLLFSLLRRCRCLILLFIAVDFDATPCIARDTPLPRHARSVMRKFFFFFFRCRYGERCAMPLPVRCRAIA